MLKHLSYQLHLPKKERNSEHSGDNINEVVSFLRQQPTEVNQNLRQK